MLCACPGDRIFLTAFLHVKFSVVTGLCNRRPRKLCSAPGSSRRFFSKVSRTADSRPMGHEAFRFAFCSSVVEREGIVPPLSYPT